MYFSRPMQNHILQLLQQHGFVVEESGCWIGLQSRSFTYREHLVRHSTKNMSKMTTNSSAAGNLYQARMGPNSNTKTPETHNLDAQTSSNCFEKKRRCYTMVNMPPSQLFSDLYQASNLKWAHFVHNIFKFLSLNIYVIYVLLWIKYWFMWFESLSFHFIQI